MIPTTTMIFNCRPSDQKEFEKYGAYKVKDLVEWIYLHIDYLDPDLARKSFPKRVVFGDFFDEGHHRGSEYLWAKTTARRKFFDKHPPKTVYVATSRIKCAMNGDFDSTKGSAALYAWFVWQKGWKGETVVRWIN